MIRHEPPKKLDVFADSPVALSGFRGQVKKPDCSGLDLCVVAISSLYALQAMRLVGGLTGVRRRNHRFLTYRLII